MVKVGARRGRIGFCTRGALEETIIAVGGTAAAGNGLTEAATTEMAGDGGVRTGRDDGVGGGSLGAFVTSVVIVSSKGSAVEAPVEITVFCVVTAVWPWEGPEVGFGLANLLGVAAAKVRKNDSIKLLHCTKLELEVICWPNISFRK